MSTLRLPLASRNFGFCVAVSDTQTQAIHCAQASMSHHNDARLLNICASAFHMYTMAKEGRTAELKGEKPASNILCPYVPVLRS